MTELNYTSFLGTEWGGQGGLLCPYLQITKSSIRGVGRLGQVIAFESDPLGSDPGSSLGLLHWA